MLADAGIAAEVTGRPKHIYSIWNKMRAKGLDFEEVHDVRALRVIVPTAADCYSALGVVHDLWEPIPKEFDDYISRPKGNNYRSLHTAVIGPEDKPLEVQIRTYEMHQHSEYGVAAHWRYKEGGGRDAAYDRKVQWLRQLLAPAGNGEADLVLEQGGVRALPAAGAAVEIRVGLSSCGVASGAEPVRRRFLCGSWRCRRCARWRGALDWARCAAAVSSRGW